MHLAHSYASEAPRAHTHVNSPIVWGVTEGPSSRTSLVQRLMSLSMNTAHYFGASTVVVVAAADLRHSCSLSHRPCAGSAKFLRSLKLLPKDTE
jgi:hypothetical protein